MLFIDSAQEPIIPHPTSARQYLISGHSPAHIVRENRNLKEEREQNRRLQHLLHKISEAHRNKNIPKCRKCTVENSTCVLIPCGHLCTCSACSHNLSPYCPECYTCVDMCIQIAGPDLSRWKVENCQICQENLADSIVLGCGHIYMCKECIHKSVTDENHILSNCLICNERINRTITILPALSQNCSQQFIDRQTHQSTSGLVPQTDISMVSKMAFTNAKRNCCKFCLCEPINTAFMPCGHTMTCVQCSTKLLNQKCKTCHVKMTRIVRFYSNQPARTSASGRECIICTEYHDKLMAFLPCGHTDICVSCARRIRTISGHNCPICRARIMKSVEVN